MTKYIGVLLLILIIAAGVVWQRQQPTAADPLAGNRVELQRARIEQQTEAIRLERERQAGENAVMLANIARRERIETSKGVTAAAVFMAAAWRLSPVILFVTTIAGAGVYAFARRVPVKTPFVETMLPVRKASAIVEKSLMVSNAAEMARIMAFSEDITRARIGDMTNFARAIRPGRETFNISNQSALPAVADEHPQAGHVPTFAALLSAGEIGAGLPLLMGFTQDGTAQRRTIKDIKALSVAGQQGAGKTASMAYLITSTLLLSDEAEGYVVDPHWKHDEGLGAMIRPLEQTGRLHLINPMDISATIDALDARLDRRLAGQESSDVPILFCVDELAKMGKSPMFAEKLLPFVERFTEETRKAGMIGVFGSQKWNARHFGNKADIRATIPSLLIHKIKPSQADLLLEDSENKKLMKHVSLPGQALMATSHDADPSVITVPFITRHDIEEVARMLSAKFTADAAQVAAGTPNGENVMDDTDISDDATETNARIHDTKIIPFRRMKHDETTTERQTTGEAQETMDDDEMRRKIKEMIDANIETLSGIANKIGMNKGGVYRFLKENQIPSPTLRAALASFLRGSPMKQEA